MSNSSKEHRHTYYQEHKEKLRAYAKAYRELHREELREKARENFPKYYAKYRDYERERKLVQRYKKYGLDVGSYNQMFEEQGGYCAICGRHQSEFNKRLYVDHDHETGQVRSLLCNQCNAGLGMFGDNADILDAAKEYLNVWKSRHKEIRSTDEVIV